MQKNHYFSPVKFTDREMSAYPFIKSFGRLLITLFFIQTSFLCIAQTNINTPDNWVKYLKVKDTLIQKNIEEIINALRKSEPFSAYATLNELEKKGDPDNKYFELHFKIVKALWLWNTQHWKAKKAVVQLFQQALTLSYEINKPLVIAEVSWNYGQTMYAAGDIAPAAMYCLNAMEIWEGKGVKKGPFENFLLGEIFYHTRDYKKSIYYNKKSIEATQDTSITSKKEVMSRWNTVALCWQKLKEYDSAFYYYGKATQISDETNSLVWKGIISGNRGQIYFIERKYDIAKTLLTFDYLTSKKYREWDNAANSLQWVARINLLQGKKDSALIQVKEAMQLLSKKIFPGYYQNLYYTTSEVYRALGKNDSAYKYAQLYIQNYDSTENAVASSRLEISQIKLNNLQNILVIKNLQKEEDKAALQRNFIIAAIIILAFIAVLIVMNQRQKIKYQQQMVLQQKAAAETEINAAKEQMQLFTQNIIEKTTIIEKLEQQLNNKTITAEQQEIMNELSHQSILTEADWEKFKLLFEKIRPDFFSKIIKTASNITVAEQRMAALICLHLSTRQMASMLGISPNSVNKTKQRLRQRFNLEPETNIEDILENM
ncbi:MAG: hypothetical protein JST21_13380 [Bacteroidetes bacterium]|nr:hypothetical protein [Bacteroidota bacterium]